MILLLLPAFRLTVVCKVPTVFQLPVLAKFNVTGLPSFTLNCAERAAPLR